MKVLVADMINGLTFLKEAAPHISPSRRTRKGLFRCSCGNEFETIIRSVVSGNTKSCGCYGKLSRSERFTKHGLRNHELYGVYTSINTRCFNKNRTDYKYYGGRGITLSDEFKDFTIWFNHVVSLPNYENRNKLNLTLDRIDNNKGYERGNLKWSTKKEQANNRINNITSCKN